MSAQSVSPSFPVFNDAAGAPLEAGYIYIGQVNLNPETHPIAVYWDKLLTVPAAQPIRTSGGFPVRNGTPAVVYTNSDYSITVKDKKKRLIYTSPSTTERITTSMISDFSLAALQFVQDGTGAVVRDAQMKLRESVSVQDYGGVADAKEITDATVSLATPTTLTSASANFVAADVGKRIIVFGADIANESIADATMVLGSAHITAGSGTPWPATQYWSTKRILVKGAGVAGADLLTSIVSRVSDTELILADVAATGVAGVSAYYGQDSMVATITGFVSSTQVTMSIPMTAAVTNVVAEYGTDNYQAFQDAVAELTKRGGGTLVAQGPYLICTGADGNCFLQKNLDLVLQDITFDFRGATFYGNLILNKGSPAPLTKNFTLLGGIYKGVGDLTDGCLGSAGWNQIVCTYGENIKILGPTIYVPPGSRALSLQSGGSSGGAGIVPKLKNIIVDDYLIIGPSFRNWTTDGFDLMQDGTLDGMMENVAIGDGIVLNTGRGLIGFSGPNSNYNLSIGNLQIINPAVNGVSIENFDGLRIGNLSVTGQGKHASVATYSKNGVGVYLSNNDNVMSGVISVEGAPGLGAGGLVTAFDLNDSTTTRTQRYESIRIASPSSSTWVSGFAQNASAFFEIGTLSIENSITAYVNSDTGAVGGGQHPCTIDRLFVDESCTNIFTQPISLPSINIYDAFKTRVSSQNQPYGQIQTRPGFGAGNASTKTNVTGDGTAYTVVFDGESWDNGGNYDNAGSFTAPYDGVYHFDIHLYLGDLAAGHTNGTVYLYVNAGGTGIWSGNPYALSTGGLLLLSLGKTMKLSKGDVVQVRLTVSGGAKAVDVNDSWTGFEGFLVR